MAHYTYSSLFLVLLKGRYELFGPVDSLWTGGKLLLHGLDLPRVDDLFAFTETEPNTHYTPKMVQGRISGHLNTHSGDSCTKNWCVQYMTGLSASENAVHEGNLGRRRRRWWWWKWCALKQAAVVCFLLFFCFLFYAVRWIKKCGKAEL